VADRVRARLADVGRPSASTQPLTFFPLTFSESVESMSGMPFRTTPCPLVYVPGFTTRKDPRMNAWTRQKYVYVPGGRLSGVE